MARVNCRRGILTETAGLTLGLKQAEDVVNLDCRGVSGMIVDGGGMMVLLVKTNARISISLEDQCPKSKFVIC